MYRPIPTRSLHSAVLLCLVSAGFLASAAFASAPPPSDERGAALPTSFIENCGQLDETVRYSVRARGVDAFFLSRSVVLSMSASQALEGGASRTDTALHRARLELEPVGTQAGQLPEPLELLPGRVNVYRGSQHIEGIGTFGGVVYRGLYSGIDLVYRADGRRLKSDWIVAPGARPEEIRWRYRGAIDIAIRSGQLHIETPLGVLVEAAPTIFQEQHGDRTRIEGGFRLLGNGEVGFWVGDHDPSRPLVIDPSLEWSTYLGGSEEEQARTLAVDSSGNVYVAGLTRSTDFPATVGAFDTSYGGGFYDGWVAKLDGTGALIWATYIGGDDKDIIDAIAVDASGQVTFGGETLSSDFPVTPGAYDTTLDASEDGMIGRLDATAGTLVFATYLGGMFSDRLHALALDAAGNVLVAGETDSLDFPTTPGVFDAIPDFGSGFVTKLDATGSTLLYSTMLGGGTSFCRVFAMEVDGGGNAYLTGQCSGAFPTTPGAFDTQSDSGDTFVTKLDPTGSSLVYSTFFGGATGGGFGTIARAITVDDQGRAVICGYTSSPDLAVTPGSYDTVYSGQNGADGFIAQLSATGAALVFATYLGGGGTSLQSIDLEPGTGRVLVGGSGVNDFPTTPGAFDEDAYRDGVVALLDATGSSLLYATGLGGSAFDTIYSLAFNPLGFVSVAGLTTSSDFPITPGAFDQTANPDDAFVTALRPGPILSFHGAPSSGQSVHYEIDWAASAETGNLAQVFLSCSGTSGVQLPGKVILPLTVDNCTRLGIFLASILQGTIDTTGHAASPVTAFPAVQPGITVYSAASTWDVAHPRALSVTPPITYVTQ
ncbi:MAG: SBBP repeat-containing protein [Planctomycetota bacterium]